MEDELYRKARERVKEIRGFFSHLIVYIIINVVFIYFIGKSWLWVTAFWGMGLLFQLLNTFLLGKEWEEKKIREYIEKEKSLKETIEENKKEENKKEENKKEENKKEENKKEENKKEENN